MSNPTYGQLLSTPEWNFKRQEILERDNHQCQRCGATAKLQVHHRYYIAPRLPWNYPDFALITLCDSCHEAEHTPFTYNIWEFICHDLRLDSTIAPLFSTCFRERSQEHGVGYETLMAGLIAAMDDETLRRKIIKLGKKKVKERDDWQLNQVWTEEQAMKA